MSDAVQWTVLGLLISAVLAIVAYQYKTARKEQEKR